MSGRYAMSNGSSQVHHVGVVPTDCEQSCRECGGMFFEGNLRIGRGSYQWVQDEEGNPHRGSWRCFDEQSSCVDAEFLLRLTDGQGEAYDLAQLSGFDELEASDQAIVREKLKLAEAQREEVDAGKKERREARKEEKRQREQARQAKAEERKAAKKKKPAGSGPGSNLVPCPKCGVSVHKNALSMHECKKAILSDFFGAKKKEETAPAADLDADLDLDLDPAPAASDEPATAPEAAPKKRKDPNAPKKGKSAYLFYKDANTAAAKEANEGKTSKELTELLKQQWEGLGEEEKKPYEEQVKSAQRRLSLQLSLQSNDKVFAVAGLAGQGAIRDGDGGVQPPGRRCCAREGSCGAQEEEEEKGARGRPAEGREDRVHHLLHGQPRGSQDGQPGRQATGVVGAPR